MAHELKWSLARYWKAKLFENSFKNVKSIEENIQNSPCYTLFQSRHNYDSPMLKRISYYKQKEYWPHFLSNGHNLLLRSISFGNCYCKEEVSCCRICPSHVQLYSPSSPRYIILQHHLITSDYIRRTYITYLLTVTSDYIRRTYITCLLAIKVEGHTYDT